MKNLPRRRLLQAGSLAFARASLGAPLFIPQALASTADRFAAGIASGEPTPGGVVLWTRLFGADLGDRTIEVTWEVAEDEAFSRIAARGTEPAPAAWAHSVHAEPAGLRPDRPYWYRFTALGQRSPVGRTRTAPAPDADASLRVVIASCQRYDVGHYAAWRHAAASSPDLVLFLGDYIYETGSPAGRLRPHQGGYVKTLDQYRARYAQYKSDPHLQAAHAAAPWMVTWDDHEVDNDYAGLQGQRLQSDFAQQRAAAYQAYWEHMPLPHRLKPDLSVRGGSMALFRRHDWGRLARIHLVDDRQYRDPQVCPRSNLGGGSNTVSVRECPDLLRPERSLLGRVQEDWLEQGWDLERPWNLLAQQTLMAPLSWTDPAGPEGGTYWTDGWSGYPGARQRLLKQVADRGLKGVVVLGGDVHANYVADLRAGDGPVLATEFCGTSITSTGLPNDRVMGARAINPHLHHARSDERGYVALELDARGLRARLEVVQDILDPQSPVTTSARFTVDPRSPGVRAA